MSWRCRVSRLELELVDATEDSREIGQACHDKKNFFTNEHVFPVGCSPFDMFGGVVYEKSPPPPPGRTPP